VLPESAELLQEDVYNSLSDEEIAKRAKDGDLDACDFLVRKYKSFVKARTKSFFLIGAERDDVVQEGMIGLYKAIQSFEPDKRATFKTFAELCITRHIITAVKSSMRQKHIPLNNYVSLNKEDSGAQYLENCRTGSSQAQNPEQLLIDEENIRDVEDCMGEVLSSFEARVLAFHLNGFGYSKIAELIGKDAKSVDNALQRIKRKLEKYLRERK
jgi:RNA polymerase sporulation-specific sigma factor